MAARDIAQEIINAVRTKQPDYVVAALVEEREQKLKSTDFGGYTPPSTASILTTAGYKVAGSSYSASEASVQAVDANGITTVAPTGTEYDPKDYLTNAATNYTTEGSTSTSSGIENIIGYALLFLIGIALLEKFFGSGSKKG